MSLCKSKFSFGVGKIKNPCLSILKTASWTGEIKNIGGSKTITSDGLTLDRDLNGARGIFLRATVDTPLLRDNLLQVCC